MHGGVPLRCRCQGGAAAVILPITLSPSQPITAQPGTLAGKARLGPEMPAKAPPAVGAWGKPRCTKHPVRAALLRPVLSSPRIKNQGRDMQGMLRQRGGGDGSPGHPRYLLVSLQLAGEGALVEEELQALLGVVVAELLEGGPPALPRQLGVLRPRGVHHRHRAHRVLARLQCPGQGTKGRRGVSRCCWPPTSALPPVPQHVPVEEGDEEGEELGVQASRHALQALQRRQLGTWPSQP